MHGCATNFESADTRKRKAQKGDTSPSERLQVDFVMVVAVVAVPGFVMAVVRVVLLPLVLVLVVVVLLQELVVVMMMMPMPQCSSKPAWHN